MQTQIDRLPKVFQIECWTLSMVELLRHIRRNNMQPSVYCERLSKVEQGFWIFGGCRTSCFSFVVDLANYEINSDHEKIETRPPKRANINKL